MKVEGVNFFPADIIRTRDDMVRHSSNDVSMADAIVATEASYRCAAYERYLVAKLEKENG